MNIIFKIDTLLFIITAIFTGYNLLFTFASLFKRKKKKVDRIKMQNIAVIFAAYKEDKVIKESIEKFLKQDYPQDKYQVVVVSDHMKDITNSALSQMSITLFVVDFKDSMKHKSISYALDHLNDFDRVVIMDADNITDTDFLTRINEATQTVKVLQAHRTQKNKNTSVAIWDGISEEINNTIFRKGRVNLGLSSALIGSGMVFDFNWLKQHMHECKTFAEDKELEAILAKDNVFVDYSDDIYVYDEKTARQDILIRQRSRWFHAQILAFFLITKDFNLQKINPSYLDKIIQWIPFPRTVRFLFIFLMILFWSVVAFPVAIKWYILLIIKIATYLLAIPRKMYTYDFFTSIIQLPSMMIALLRSYIASICRVKKKDMRFNNTPHHITKENNHG
ncbi:glycosyltransferase [Parabacteroides sp. GYB001]|uniref:glycosyltransferase n=1 Tax=Parabacteroides leei TaxID=2939491 RepID=UPI0020177F0F|nr:glycosyltransferase family 2 protein [Parabacteroides leei]MCL3851895.1 glycosyltransferase [Parabacteroides leei]